MRALVIGSGAGVVKELRKAPRCDYRIGVNQAAVDFAPVHYHCTLHPQRYAPIKAGVLVSHKHAPGVDRIFPWKPGNIPNSGSSGLYAVRFALEELKADEVILAGVGIDNTPHYYGGAAWADCLRFRDAWTSFLPHLQGRVFSLGGWTAELLGTPNPPATGKHRETHDAPEA